MTEENQTNMASSADSPTVLPVCLQLVQWLARIQFLHVHWREHRYVLLPLTIQLNKAIRTAARWIFLLFAHVVRSICQFNQDVAAITGLETDWYKNFCLALFSQWFTLFMPQCDATEDMLSYSSFITLHNTGWVSFITSCFVCLEAKGMN